MLTVLQPDVHWYVIGVVRGEAFYQGRPTSWWAWHVESSYEPAPFVPAKGNEIVPPHWMLLTPPSIADRLLAWPGPPPTPWFSDAILSHGFGDAIPVLLELLPNPSVKVRQLAVFALRCLGFQNALSMELRAAWAVEAGQRFLPILRKVAKEDEDELVRWLAGDAVRLIEVGPKTPKEF